MSELDALAQRLDDIVLGAATNPDELLAAGERVLEAWVRAHGLEPTEQRREGFRLLALHRQGAGDDPSFNACRETCRELVYHYNLLTGDAADERDRAGDLKMMALVANHLFLFVSGKLEDQEIGDFCCSAKPLHDDHEATATETHDA
jgi:hypothetical protein|tara:strand:- start:1474 stop:1914 length:441 start_codon:yes stop_codon:yes gene_type:complete